MTSREFDAIVDKAIAKVPLRFRRHINNLVFLVRKDSPDPELLGLYVGRPLTERRVSDPFGLPDNIIIFQRPHERMARDEEHLEKLVAETVWHEVAHYFGLDEKQVLRAERRRAMPKNRRIKDKDV